MYVALRELRVARGRFMLVGSVVALVALMTTLLSGLANGLVDDGISGLRQLPLTHLAFQKGAQDTFSRSTLTDAALTPWQGVDGVQASPLGVSFANARTAAGTTVDLALFGVPEGSFLVTGDAAAALGKGPGLVLDTEFQGEGIKVGDELTIVGVDQRLPVLGFTDSGSYGHVDIAFLSLAHWQRLLYGDNARGRFSAIALTAADDATITKAAASVEEQTGTETVTKDAAYAGSPGYTGETQTMSMIRWFLLAISALIVGAFFIVWTMQRSRQIALLKALGASNGYVLRDAVGQLAVVLVLAAVLGGAVAFGLGGLVGRSAVPFHLVVGTALTALGLLVVVGMAGCLAGVRRVTSVDPSMSLRAAD